MFKEEETQYCPMCEEWAEKYDQLKAENETLFKAIEEVNKINKRLKAENEELRKFQKLLEEQMKFNKSELELSLSSEIKRSEFLLREFKKVDKQRDNWREKAEKYFKTLTEIKEIAEYLITTTDEYDSCYYKDKCSKCEVKEDCQYFKVEQILQKISEMEDEKV